MILSGIFFAVASGLALYAIHKEKLSYLKWAVISLFAVIATMLAALPVASQYNHAEKLAQYYAWSKHTGNPGQLSFEEWKHYNESQRRRSKY